MGALDSTPTTLDLSPHDVFNTALDIIPTSDDPPVPSLLQGVIGTGADEIEYSLCTTYQNDATPSTNDPLYKYTRSLSQYVTHQYSQFETPAFSYTFSSACQPRAYDAHSRSDPSGQYFSHIASAASLSRSNTYPSDPSSANPNTTNNNNDKTTTTGTTSGPSAVQDLLPIPTSGSQLSPITCSQDSSQPNLCQSLASAPILSSSHEINLNTSDSDKIIASNNNNPLQGFSLTPLRPSCGSRSTSKTKSEVSKSASKKSHKYAAPRPCAWTHVEEELLVSLICNGAKWPEITKHFPNRSAGAIKKHYYADMKQFVWPPEDVQRLFEAVKLEDKARWKRIGDRLGKSPRACERKYRQLESTGQFQEEQQQQNQQENHQHRQHHQESQHHPLQQQQLQHQLLPLPPHLSRSKTPIMVQIEYPT